MCLGNDLLQSVGKVFRVKRNYKGKKKDISGARLTDTLSMESC